MEIRRTYKFEYEKNGMIITGISAGFLPDYAIRVLNEYDVLYPDKGMILVNKETKEKRSSVIIQDKSEQENWEEIEREEPPFERDTFDTKE